MRKPIVILIWLEISQKYHIAYIRLASVKFNLTIDFCTRCDSRGALVLIEGGGFQLKNRNV